MKINLSVKLIAPAYSVPCSEHTADAQLIILRSHPFTKFFFLNPVLNIPLILGQASNLIPAGFSTKML